MPPARPTTPASTTMPNRSSLARTAARPPLSPKMNVPARLSARISVGSKPRGTSTAIRMSEGAAGYTRGMAVLDGLDAITSDLEELYRDVHAHPELSMQEHRTAAKAAERLEAAGYEVTAGIGATGVV